MVTNTPSDKRPGMNICVNHLQSLESDLGFPLNPTTLRVLLTQQRKIKIKSPDRGRWLEVLSVKMFHHVPSGAGAPGQKVRRFMIRTAEVQAAA